MEKISKYFIKEKIRFIDLEYFLGFILAFTLWGYYLIQTANISQYIAKDCKFNRIME